MAGRQLFAVLAGALVLGALGCGKKAASRGYGAESHPEAVVVDFFSGSTPTATCSGTLVSSNVVLTTAHCVRGSTAARVIVPSIKGATSDVAAAFVYESDPGRAVDSQFDLGLLVLDVSFRLPHYAAVQLESCDGCSVVGVNRVRGVRAALTQTSTMALAARPSRAHSLAMYAPIGTNGDSGGGVFRASGPGQGLLVGVAIGSGQESGGAYYARLDNPDVQRWIRDIVHFAYGVRTTGLRTMHAGAGGLHLLDDSTGDDGTGDDGTGDDSSGDDGSGNDTSGDPSGDDGGADQGGEPDPVQSGDDTGGDPSGDDGGTVDNGSDDGGDDGGVVDNGGDDAGDDGGVGDDAGDDGGVGDGGGTLDDDAAADGGDGASDDGGASGGDGGDDGGTPNEDVQAGGSPDRAAQKIPPKKEYVDPKTGIWTGTRDTLYVKQGCNQGGTCYWDAFNKSQTNGMSQEDRDMAMRGVNVCGSHGDPGYMEAVCPPDALQTMAQNGHPIVVASCDAAAVSGDSTNIANLAAANGLDPTKVYGCTDYVGGGGECLGTWTDATGMPLDQNTLDMYGLKNNCTQTCKKVKKQTQCYISGCP